MILLLISFIAGVLTALAPCVLPLLPVIVGGSISGETSSRRAYTISISLGLSVILFTLLLKVSSVFINVPPNVWAWGSGGVLILFGFVMIFPRLWDRLGFVNLMNRSGNQLLATGYQKNSFSGDVLMGAALGPVFSSCSPTYFVILATVLPASFAMGLLDLAAYAIGLSGFLLIIAIAGQKLVDHLGVAINPEGWFRRMIGVLFLVVGFAVFTGAETRLEAYLLNHGFDLTGIEQRLLRANEPPPSPSCKNGVCPGITSPQIATSSTDISVKSDPVADASLAMILAHKAGMYKKSAELVTPDGYINTGGKPIRIGDFKGSKVVLIDIWTYSCINCQRTLPYIKAWYDKYHDQGLEIIGVHTPEFAFEKVQKNVQDAVMSFGIKYPVVLDNEYKTWNAFGNQYWPRKYLVDIDGYIVYDHAGEGSYDEAEKAIQAALAERATRLKTEMPTTGIAAPKDVVSVESGKLGSPETYFGAARNEYLGNGTRGTVGFQSFEEPLTVLPSTLYFAGPWDIQSEFAQTSASIGGSAGSARIEYRYQAKGVYFVAGSVGDAPIEIEILRDSKPLEKSYAGADVYFKDGKSYIKVTNNRLYKIIEDSDYGDHLLEFIISKPGLQAYTFTFG